LGAGVVVAAGEVVSGCGHAIPRASHSTDTAPTSATTSTTLPPVTTTTAPVVALGQIPPRHPGPPQVISRAPAPTNQIAITIDDGFCVGCADAYVDFVERTGLHITFSPNGQYQGIWNPLASRLQAMISTGQVQIGNHTFSHTNLLNLSDLAIGSELERNDEWIQTTFGITSRPWFRPPYGAHNPRVDQVAANAGYTHIVMWNGSFGDSTPISPNQLLALANQYLNPGTIMLGHANYPTILPLLSQIVDLIGTRALNPVTLDEMFTTSRNSG
jgi:peptidoglycan/xylan/chitin deacetylase (PgdA/CDA1 family)